MLRNVTIAASTFAVIAIVAFSVLAVLTLTGIWPDQSAPRLTSQEISAELDPHYTTHTVGGDRPATLVLPLEHHGGPLPLVIGLHGYGGHAWEFETTTRLTQRVEADEIALLLPQGTEEQSGDQFWNATGWCCDLENSEVDDVEYFHALMEEVESYIPIDGVYIYGHSNGGFMSYRLACESFPNLVAIASMSGTSFEDEDQCEGANPVSILHIHGTEDDVVLYGGSGASSNAEGYAAAHDVVREWAQRANCHETPDVSAPPLDLDEEVEGAETTITRYVDCDGDRAIELWTVNGADHSPSFDHAEEVSPLLIEWFLDRATPTPGP